MSIARLERVSRVLGGRTVLTDVEAAVAGDDRIGVVGPNGGGKTTLLRLLAGLDEPDGGRVVHRRGLRVGFLPQEAHRDPSVAAAPDLRAAVRSAAGHLLALAAELEALEAAGEVLNGRYGELQARFEAAGGYSLEARIDALLSGVGFRPSDWGRRPADLSGGELTRLALVRLLVADHDLLVLDEPTNHLDLEAMEWLEAELGRHRGAIVVASHDRAFLDRAVRRIWEVREGRVRVFRGGYSAYRRQAGATTTSWRAPVLRDGLRRGTGAALAPSGGSGSLLRAEGLAVGFFLRPSEGGPLVVARASRLEVAAGERIGVVGANGTGKTTLLRTLAGDLPPVEGTISLGPRTEIGYLPQVPALPPVGATVLDAVLAAWPTTPGEARAYLARFLFRGDDVFTPVAALSGGERARLALALLALRPADLLLLDEPTNHLDVDAREALEEWLTTTPAAVVLASHDRRLLEDVCQRLWIVAEGLVVPFDGGYREWRAAVEAGWRPAAGRVVEVGGTGIAPPPGTGLGRRRPGSSALRTAGPPTAVPQSATASPSASPPPDAPPVRPPLSKEQYRRQAAALEERLAALQQRRAEILAALAQPSVQANFVELRRLTGELAEVEADLQGAEEAWLELAAAAPPGAAR
jgi:ATP-binding cassette subfamily F protein 3